MTSKSGGNRYTGATFGAFRNEKFVARNPFRDAPGAKPPAFRQSQFATNLGGPLVRNKTFFFGSYDGWRFRDRPDTRLTVPAGRELDGDFADFHGPKLPSVHARRERRLVRDRYGHVLPAN